MTMSYNQVLNKLGKTLCSIKHLKNNSNESFSSSLFSSRSYRAAVLKRLNESIILEEQKQPSLKKGQVRIGVHACSVNASDLLMCQGVSKLQPLLPFVPGFEISGEVLETNLDDPIKKKPKKVEEKAKEKDKKDSKKESKDKDSKEKKKSKEKDDDDDDDEEFPVRVGERVVALSREHLGGFSQECIVDVKDAWRIPSSMTYETAAALTDSYSLALLGLARRAQIKINDIVLITAGPGGLGLAAIDIAANVFKAKVIGVCGTEDNGETLRNKGAWSAITFGESALKSKVQEISGRHGVDIVFETVGGPVFSSAMNSVAHEGKVIVGGFASHQIPDIPMSDLLMMPSFSLIGVSLRNYRESDYKVYRQIVNDVLVLYERGLINPIISETFPLDKVNEALLHILETKTIGKLVLKTSSK